MDAGDPGGGAGADYQAVAATIRRRRTSLLVDPTRPVPAQLVGELINLAACAPNHHRSWPWRFAVLTGEARRRLGDLVAAYGASTGVPEAKVAKARTKYLRAPVVVLIGMRSDDRPVRRREDRDAVAAAVENLLLAATAAGLASHWATGDWMADGAVKALAGLDPPDELVALVYLGWPSGTIPPVERPHPPTAWLDS